MNILVSCDETFLSFIFVTFLYLIQKCTKSLVRALKDVVNSPHAPEYDVSGISDPFLHIRLLRVLRVLGHGDTNASEYMSDTLAQVIFLLIMLRTL